MTVAGINPQGTLRGLIYQSYPEGILSPTVPHVLQTTGDTLAANASENDQATTPPAAGNDESFSQIESLVNAALNSAVSNAAADPPKIIQVSIEQVFQAGGAPTAASAAAAVNSTSAGGTDSTGGSGSSATSLAAAATTTTAPTTTAATQSFLQALHSLSVDPQQFHDDLLSAIKDARQGKFDPSAVFRNFPVGSSVDAVA